MKNRKIVPDEETFSGILIIFGAERQRIRTYYGKNYRSRHANNTPSMGKINEHLY
ncbi:hypothetical protein [Bacteroides acidifaciens]|uniref:hypothetical protein n=1 Tax=Bacteroides acidifaciens TaxID=85831 RepID=UPI0025B76F89|nr:hypothetical protein [Bacteroides acidifaciens]